MQGWDGEVGGVLGGTLTFEIKLVNVSQRLVDKVETSESLGRKEGKKEVECLEAQNCF